MGYWRAHIRCGQWMKLYTITKMILRELENDLIELRDIISHKELRRM